MRGFQNRFYFCFRPNISQNSIFPLFVTTFSSKVKGPKNQYFPSKWFKFDISLVRGFQNRFYFCFRPNFSQNSIFPLFVTPFSSKVKGPKNQYFPSKWFKFDISLVRGFQNRFYFCFRSNISQNSIFPIFVTTFIVKLSEKMLNGGQSRGQKGI